jgi:sigma-B regulation protein RsbU (phosphoserine phosphatase)
MERGSEGDEPASCDRVLRIADCGSHTTDQQPPTDGSSDVGGRSSDPNPQSGEGSRADERRTRRAWLAHVRHEMRAPVDALLDCSRLLLETIVSLGLRELDEVMEAIQAAGRMLTERVDQLLAPQQVDLALHLETAALGDQIRHDLRTPLTILIGYSEMLLEDTTRSDPEPFVAELRNLSGASRKLLGLIGDLTRFSRREHGADEPSGTGSDVASMIRDVVATIRPLEDGPARAVGPGGHLLVVDDSEANRDLLSRRLEREGYGVTTARHGREALERLGEEPFDLVLLDIMMPEMNGYQVLERMKGDPRLCHLPVIMISALDDLDTVVRCIEIGAEDYLCKPFSPVLLRARIGACLEKKRLRDQELRAHQALRESQQHLAAELAEAAGYVQSLLPAPLSGEVTTEWQFVPSSQLGGDSFGYHWIDAEHFAIYLLDVCGHGVGPALLSVTAMNCLRAQMLPGTDFREPGEVLRALNRVFQMRAQNNTYFTIWYGVYRRGDKGATKGRLTYASGGHPPAILLAGPEASPLPLRTRGPIIGALPDVVYKSEQCELEEPSRLFVFSDGAYEVTRRDGTMLTLDEFTAILSRPPEPGVATVEQVWRTIQELCGSEALEDDFSLVQVTFQ